MEKEKLRVAPKTRNSAPIEEIRRVIYPTLSEEERIDVVMDVILNEYLEEFKQLASERWGND